MNITKKLRAKQSDIFGQPSVTIAFLGDSVTQGCFECQVTPEGKVEPVTDYSCAYSTRLREILNLLYPTAQLNIINSGISGDSAAGGLARLERDVLRFQPDLTVVSYGLNDACREDVTVQDYTAALREILTRLRDAGSETVFLTQNHLAGYVSTRVPEGILREVAANYGCCKDRMRDYMTAARSVAAECGVRVCDVFPVWEAMERCGVDTTRLLSNGINHPIRAIHTYMAMRLAETILDVR